jgi:glycosyltransferase involved in cell wall biosynthesis
MVCARYLPLTGGVETHVFETSRRIAESGYDVRILTTDTTGALPNRAQMGRVPVVRVPAWPRWSDVRFAPSVYAEIVADNCDLVHIQGYNTLVAPVAMMAALRSGKPFVLSFHSGGHSSRLRNMLRQTQYLSLAPLVRRAAQLVGVSEFEADFFSRAMAIGRDRFEVAPNGAGLPKPSSPPKGRAQEPLILSIGRLERYKGHHRAIEAMPHLLRLMPQASLRIVGVGPYETELRNLTARLGLERNVTIAGVPPGDRTAMADLVARAALVVLFSDYEAHPLAVAEALSLGRPVLASDNSGLREMVADGRIHGAPTEASASERAHLICKAMESAPTAFQGDLPTWDDCADRLVTIYRRLLLAS